MTVSKHPNPQFERGNWISLNGEWDFAFSPLSKPRAKRFRTEQQIQNEYAAEHFSHKINVPFCPQSVLSGIAYTDFIGSARYRKMITCRKNGQRVILHIGAADYLTTVFINGKPAGRHYGGYTSFSFDITELLTDGENEVYIYCEDNEKNPLVCRGKQCEKRKSQGCDYTRTTGIWQNVYLEYVPQSYIKQFKIVPDYQQSTVTVTADLVGTGTLQAAVYYEGKPVGSAETNGNELTVKLTETHLWEVGAGRLYDLTLTYGEDKVKSYFGLRNVTLDGLRFLLNGKSVFQRLVLDQGFYKKGIYTAQDDAGLLRDIHLSKALGFNGARLHQKVFDPRFLYFCDREGYLVWGEYANWGLDYSDPEATAVFLREWEEVLARDFNHPAIIGWCPFNETWDYKGRPQRDSLLADVYDFTKRYVPTRPCIDTSGNFHVKTDIFDLHDYRYDPVAFRTSYDKFVTDNELYQHVLLENEGRQVYRGEPVFISEYGGIKWEADRSVKAWGYGADVKTPEEFAKRYAALTAALIENEKFFGFCYTQLYDIEQEQNGLYTYDREPKFDQSIYEQIKAANTEKAAIE